MLGYDHLQTLRPQDKTNHINFFAFFRIIIVFLFLPLFFIHNYYQVEEFILANLLGSKPLYKRAATAATMAKTAAIPTVSMEDPLVQLVFAEEQVKE